MLKNALYAGLIASGGCPIRPGIWRTADFGEDARSTLAIATTTSRDNVNTLLKGSLDEDWARSFAVIVADDEVPRKKPASDVHLEVLSRLKLPASECLAIEDSGNGLVAASGAGIPVLILRSGYLRDDSFTGALLAVDDLTDVTET